MILRGFVGAAIGASAVALVALLLPVVSRWVDGGTNGARPASPNALASIPDDIGPALRPDATSTHKRRAHAKPKAEPRPAVLVGGNVVVLSGTGTGTGTGAAPTHAATPDPAPVATNRPAQRPAKPKAPKKAPKVGIDESNPVVPTPVPAPVPAPVAASTGLVRLSVQSVGIAPNSSGDPELSAKLGISGAQASDALPDSVTLHLRPQLPATLQSNGAPLALKTSVDMVDAPRATAADPALRLRVRMTIAPSQTVTAASAPVVEDPGPGDGKSNVVAVTVPLTSFVRVAPDDPVTPPGDQGGADPSTPPDNQAPGDGGTAPQQPGDPTGGDPATPPQQPGDPNTPGDPNAPGQPAGGDPTTPPTTPTDPTTPTNQQPAGAPATPPTSEILIPLGERPNESTTSVPLPADPTAETPATTDQVGIIVIVEDLPPEEPPVDPAGSTPVVQDPAPEVPAPPPDSADPGTTPAPDAGSGDPTAVVVSADAPPPATNNS